MPTFTAADGLSLYYTDEGAGVPILCLAGLTRNLADFDFVAPHLADTRLIRMDYRGRGQSDRGDPSTYTVPQESADALALLDHLGVGKAAVLGTSRGGLIALGLGALHRDRVLGVCLNDIGPDIAPKGLEFIGGYLGRAPKQKTLDAWVAARPDMMPGFAGVPESRWRAEGERQFTETPEGLALRYDPKLRDAFEAVSAQPVPDLWPLFDGLAGLPLALLRGANSDILTPETAAEMRRRRPDMLYAEVPGRGHIPFLDEPDSLNVIRRWIDVL